MSAEDFLIVRITVTRQQISDLLCSAFEGGSGYWASLESTVEPTEWGFSSDPDRHYSFDFPLNPGGAATIRDDYGDYGIVTLDQDALQRGLELLIEKHPQRFARVLDEDADAEDGDVFLQLCLFGDIIYG